MKSIWAEIAKRVVAKLQEQERQRILNRMNSYFELTQYSEKYEGGQPNPEWDRGYQAAMAIAKGEQQ